jgi:hypothetical protein
MDAVQASPVSARMAVSREQNDYPLVPPTGWQAGKRIGARRKTSRPSTRSVSIAVRFEAHVSLALVPYEDGTSEFSLNGADPPPSARAHGGGAGGLNEPLQLRAKD